MGALSGDEIGHVDEAFDATVGPGVGSGFPQCAVNRFDAAVVLAGLEAAGGAGQMVGDRPREALEGIEATAPSPAEPARKQGPGLVRRLGRRVDGAPGVPDASGAGRLVVRALQPMNGLGLRGGPCGRILEQAPARRLEIGLVPDLGQADLVERLVAQREEVEAVTAHRGLGEVPGGGAGPKRTAYVHVAVRDCSRSPPGGGEIGQERLQRRLLPYWLGKHQPRSVDHRDGVELGVRLSGVRSLAVMPDHPSPEARAHQQHPTGGHDRHRRGEVQCQDFDQEREAALLAPSGHQDLGHLAVVPASHSRYFRMQVRMLGEIEMPLRACHTVVRTLGERPADRTGVPAGAEGRLEVDSSRLRVEVDPQGRPRSDRAQRPGEPCFDHRPPAAANRHCFSRRWRLSALIGYSKGSSGWQRCQGFGFAGTASALDVFAPSKPHDLPHFAANETDLDQLGRMASRAVSFPFPALRHREAPGLCMRSER